MNVQHLKCTRPKITALRTVLVLGVVACSANFSAPLCAQTSQWSGVNPGPIYYNGGNVGIGTPYPSSKLHISDGYVNVTGTTAGINISAAPTGSGYITIYSPNAQIYGSSTLYMFGATNSAYPIGGTGLGAISFRNQAWAQSAYIVSQATETHTAGGAGGNLSFATTPNGTLSPLTRMLIDHTGNVGIGTTAPQYKLAVNGTIGAKDVIVTNSGWPDYVFRPGYRLRPLSEVGAYIQAHRHLPDIPTEAEVKEKGVSLGDMQARLLAKIEEITLHLIQQEKENRELRERIAQLENRAAGTAPHERPVR